MYGLSDGEEPVQQLSCTRGSRFTPRHGTHGVYAGYLLPGYAQHRDRHGIDESRPGDGEGGIGRSRSLLYPTAHSDIVLRSRSAALSRVP